MNIRHKILVTFVMSAASCLAVGARAQSLDVTLTEGTVTSSGGTDSVDFYATITNETASTLYLNGDYFSISSQLNLDDTPFNNNAPLSLTAGENSGSFEIFDVSWSASTSLSGNSGEFSIVGGGPSDANTLGGADFSVTAPSVAAPEMDPASALAALTLMVGGVAVLRGRRAVKIDG